MTTEREKQYSPQETPRILVIDGDKTVRRTIAAILQAQGYVTETVETGKEAIEKSESTFYNLVITDVRLPDMMGTQAISEMKETVPSMIKVIIAGYAALPKAVDAVNDGADACILIPTEPEKLLNVVKKGLKKQEDAKRFSEQRIAEFIETRVRQLSNPKSFIK
jgi:DNA-binding NtrC family response regulator